MFVWPYKVILKTCGTTTLLPAVPAILELAERECGLTEVTEVFFTRKGYMEPERQLPPHTCFDAEVRYLDRFFAGAAYTIGRVNGDVWHIYMLDPAMPLYLQCAKHRGGNDDPERHDAGTSGDASTESGIATPSVADEVGDLLGADSDASAAASLASDGRSDDDGRTAATIGVPAADVSAGAPTKCGAAQTRMAATDDLPRTSGKSWGPLWPRARIEGTACAARGSRAPDQTLEIIMRGLPRHVALRFFQQPAYACAKDVTRLTGIGDLFHNAETDEVMFDPCGFSINGLLADGMFTVHVTPQEECSYASFETNIPLPSYTALASAVLKLFEPLQFSVSLMCNASAVCGSSLLAVDDSAFEGYYRCDRHHCQFAAYNLTYSHYILAPR